MNPLVIGAAAGALLGGSGPSSQTSNSLPKWYRNFLYNNGSGLLPDAQDLYEQGPTVTGFTGDQTQAMDMIRGNALDNPYAQPSQDFALDTLSGAYLNGDKFMSGYGNDILDGVNSNFSKAGRTGSGYHSKVATNELGNTASRLYEQERNNQMQMASMIPQLNASRYYDANQLMDVGNMEYDQNMTENNAEWDNLTRYANLIYGAPTGTQETVHRNPIAGAMGGAMTGMSIASKF